MPKASADRLAALVDDVHFTTRLPKHLIMGALVDLSTGTGMRWKPRLARRAAVLERLATLKRYALNVISRISIRRARRLLIVLPPRAC